MRFEIEPAPRGSGVTFKSTVPVRDILLRYQHQVEQALPLALHQGRLGWEVTPEPRGAGSISKRMIAQQGLGMV